MKPANFPCRKAERQRAAAERRIPQIRASLKAGCDNHQELKVELAALEINNAILVMPLRDVRTKKSRVGKAKFF
jgi:hypothetical protein